MTSKISVTGLIATSKKLAGVSAGAGRPALSDLRRATSTAYYALFHQVLRHAAMDFLPNATEHQIAEVARWFTHAGIRNAAGLVVTAADSKPLSSVKKEERSPVLALRAAARGAVASDVRLVADSFISLQAVREQADYDGNYDPVRAVTMNHVDDAEAAVRAARAMWRASNSPKANRQAAWAGYRCFLRLALLKSGGPRTRS